MSEEVKMPLPRSLQEIVGALLFASETPLTAGEIRDAVRAVEPEEGENAEVMGVYKTCTGREIDAALKGIAKALEVAGSGLELVASGGAYKLQTRACCGRYVRAMLKMDRPSRLGRASLETLAIIAYRQPITRGEIEEIRGVDVSGNMKILTDLQLIRLVGKSELPGHPFLYGTTPIFLEHFGLENLQQLNDLDPTLQRSNPRVKAASYRKVEKTELEKAAAEAAVPVPSESEGGMETSPSQGDSEEEAATAPSPSQNAETDELLPGFASDDADDGFFIDDTPDEFDDDDEDEDDEEDGEDEGEGEEDDES